MTTRRIIQDELEHLAYRNPGARIEFTDTDAHMTLGGVTYVAEFDARTEVA